MQFTANKILGNKSHIKFVIDPTVEERKENNKYLRNYFWMLILMNFRRNC